MTTNTRLTGAIRTELGNRIYTVLTYRRAMNPFPYATHVLDVYRSLIPPEALAAAKTLYRCEETRSVLRMTRSVNLKIEVARRDGTAYKQAFRVLLPHSTFDLEHLPPLRPGSLYYDRILTWYKRAYVIDLETYSLYEFAKHVLAKCASFGQLVQLWPMLVNAVPQGYADRLEAAQLQTRFSPLPPVIAERIDDYRNALVELDTFLALGLLRKAEADRTPDVIWIDAPSDCVSVLERARHLPFVLVDPATLAWDM